MNYTDKIITMDNGKKYIVIEQVNYDSKTYLYLVNRADEKDAMFVEISNGQILKINPELFEKTIFPLFVEKFQK